MFHVSSLRAVLSVFLWPLVSSHEVALWLEPVLQKLDFGIGEFLHRIKENHGTYQARQHVIGSLLAYMRFKRGDRWKRSDELGKDGEQQAFQMFKHRNVHYVCIHNKLLLYILHSASE